MGSRAEGSVRPDTLVSACAVSLLPVRKHENIVINAAVAWRQPAYEAFD